MRDPAPHWRDIALFLGSLLAVTGLVLWLLANEVLPREASFMVGIFVLAALLWMTEALPLFATSLLVIGLQILLLANPGGWPGLGFEQGVGPGFQDILAAAVDPVIVLFFGGLLLARAAVKEGVDGAMASLMLRPCGGGPRAVLLGIMAVTAVFSMWMSNTATAAMMITLVVPLLAALAPGEPFRKALVLAVAFAANIGGMGTPIGSPPNAIAVSYLRGAGYPLTFIEWMLLAVPLMCALLILAWLVLWLLYPPRTAGLRLEPARKPMTPRGWYAVVVFAITAGLWLSEPWHGLPAAVVALLPAIAFTATRLLDQRDVNSLDWNILILIAGGISLGAGVRMTGLDEAVVSWLGGGDAAMAGITGLAILALVTLALSTLMSNTAAANLILPIGISLATGVGPATGSVVIQFATCIALTASVSMALPVSTPPNAIAYARGEVSTRDMVLPGAVIGLLAVVFLVGGIGPVLRLWGFGG
jgi:solute carrier family 13 (sodium-dependent dicarboxylate transporter), member 2/3/5